MIHYNQVVKVKEREGILKAAREKREVTDKGIPTGLKSVDSSTETFPARRDNRLKYSKY